MDIKKIIMLVGGVIILGVIGYFVFFSGKTQPQTIQPQPTGQTTPTVTITATPSPTITLTPTNTPITKPTATPIPTVSPTPTPSV